MGLRAPDQYPYITRTTTMYTDFSDSDKEKVKVEYTIHMTRGDGYHYSEYQLRSLMDQIKKVLSYG